MGHTGLLTLRGAVWAALGFPYRKYTNLRRFPKTGDGVFKAHGGVGNLHPECIATDRWLLESLSWELRLYVSDDMGHFLELSGRLTKAWLWEMRKCMSQSSSYN